MSENAQQEYDDALHTYRPFTFLFLSRGSDHEHSLLVNLSKFQILIKNRAPQQKQGKLPSLTIYHDEIVVNQL